MSKKKVKQEFMEAIPESNGEWAAQQIIKNFTVQQAMELEACFDKLDEALYKSWAKDMSFLEVHEAVKKAMKII